MASTVHLTLTADEHKAFQAYQKLERQMNKVAAASGKIGKNTQKADRVSQGFGRSGTKALDSLLNKALGLAAAYKAVQTAVRLIGEEFEFVKQRQLRAADAANQFVLAAGSALINKPEDIGTKQLLDLVERVSKTSGLEKTALLSGIGGPLSAKGALGFGQFESAVTTAAEVARRTGTDFGILAGSLLDVQKATGVKSGEAAFAFLRSAGQQFRVTELAQQAQLIPPALLGLQTKGDTFREAAALVAATTGLTGDISGKKALSGTIGLAEKLQREEVFPVLKRGKPGETPTGELEFTKISKEFGSTLQRIGALRDQIQKLQLSEDQLDEVFGRIGGEVKTRGAFEQLILGTPTARREFENALAAIKNPTMEAAESARAFLKELRALPGAMTFDLQALGKIAVEDIKLGDVRGARAGEVRRLLEQVEQSIPSGTAIGRRFSELTLNLNDVLGDQTDFTGLVDRLESLRSRATEGSRTRYTREGMRQVVRNRDFDPQTAQILQELIDSIKELKASTDVNAQELRKASNQPQTALPVSLE